MNECNYCYGTHKAVAENFGVSSDLIEGLLQDIDTVEISKQLIPIMHYVKKLTLSPSKLVMEDAQKVYDAGWDEKTLSDVICICCLFNFQNRLLDGHGIKGNDKLYQWGANHLYKHGYGVPWFIRFIRGFIRKNKIKQLNKM